MQFFERVDADESIACPELVLLDLNLPRKDGADVLKRIRSSSRCANVIVVVVTSSASPRDLQEMRDLGANAIFQKDLDLSAFMKLGDVVRKLLGAA